MLGWGPASFIALFIFPFHRLVMRASIGLQIEGRPTEESVLGRNGGGLRGLVDSISGVLPVGYLPPPGKGKGKISEIRYPSGSEYLRAVVRCANVVGHSRVEPLFAKIFFTRYGAPSGVRIWRPDILTSYVVSVPKMVRFFEVAFENGLRFPLHPFIKCYNILMCARSNSLLIFGVSWSAFWFSSGIRASGSLVLLGCWISSA